MVQYSYIGLFLGNLTFVRKYKPKGIAMLLVVAVETTSCGYGEGKIVLQGVLMVE